MDNNFLTVKYIFFFTKCFTGCCLEEMFAKNISWPETTIGKVAHLSCKDFFPEIHRGKFFKKNDDNFTIWSGRCTYVLTFLQFTFQHFP